MSEQHCATCSCAAVGFVQKAAWGEWEAVCTIGRCGWRNSQGNETQVIAEDQLRLHSAICHPPRIPVSIQPGADQ